MKLVLVGDLHFYQLGVWPWQLLGKRVWGQVNLWINRRKKFVLERMPGVVERVGEIRPDWLLMSGDVVTTALPGEFEKARAGLVPLLDGRQAVLVPGNHDRHSFTSARKQMLETAFPDHVPKAFPNVRELDEGLYLIALDPTRANIISDKGHLGREQLVGLETALGTLPPGARVVVLCHYTLGTPPGIHQEMKRHRMIDERALAGMLGGCGREVLYLHGHVHAPFVWRLPDAPNIVAVDAGAPLMHNQRWPHGQGIWEIGTEGGWSLVHHAQTEGGGWASEAVPVPTEVGGSWM